jgi:hypothetical protein
MIHRGYKVNEELGKELNVNASGLDCKFGQRRMETTGDRL